MIVTGLQGTYCTIVVKQNLSCHQENREVNLYRNPVRHDKSEVKHHLSSI